MISWSWCWVDPDRSRKNAIWRLARLPAFAVRTCPPFARSLANTFAPALIMADHPDEIWAYDPSLEGLNGSKQ